MKATNELIDAVIKLGVPLPIYNYNSGSFKAEYMMNVPLDKGGVTGMVGFDHFKTFDEACEGIIKYYNK